MRDGVSDVRLHEANEYGLMPANLQTFPTTQHVNPPGRHLLTGVRSRAAQSTSGVSAIRQKVPGDMRARHIARRAGCR